MLGVLMCSAVHAASAQIIRPTVVSRPAGWTSLAVGWAQQQTICDPATNACWNFAGAAQYRGSLELPLGDAGAWGVAVTSSRVPLVWAGTASANSCFQCDADVNITQYLGIIRMSAGSASGFQQIVELGAGATQFTNFRTAGGSQLGTGKAVTDFSFAAAYGFGYNLQSRLQLFLVQEYGLMIHKRQTGSPNNSAQQQTFRVGARLGLGDRH
jgi:hypothetical protein